MSATVDWLCVVVPARNEEELLPLCLTSVSGAVRALARVRPEICVEVFVVLDQCTDSSMAVAADFGVNAVAVDSGCVGLARAAGITAALRDQERDPARAWIAGTDADSTVPDHWVIRQVELAEQGHDLVVGTVQPQPAPLHDVVHRWFDQHVLGEGHAQVHGANLGFRASAYLAFGGYLPLVEHEDVALVKAMRRAGLPWVATDTNRVTTSTRLSGRTPGGFAGYLQRLAVSENLQQP